MARTKVQTNNLAVGSVILTTRVAPVAGRGGILIPAYLIRGSKPATVTAVAPYANASGRRRWRITTSRGVINDQAGLSRILIADPLLDGEPFRAGDLEPGTPITWHDHWDIPDGDAGTPGVFVRYGATVDGVRACTVKLSTGPYAGLELGTGARQVRRAA